MTRAPILVVCALGVFVLAIAPFISAAADTPGPKYQRDANALAAPKPRFRPQPGKIAAPAIPKPRFRPSSEEKPALPAHPLFTMCGNLPRAVSATYQPLPPIEHPDGCNSRYPLKLEKIRTDIELRVAPAATVNCQTTAALGLWFKHHLVPLALLLFAEPVASVVNVASYACRRRYGRPDTAMSEHAFANAIDIAGFRLASGHIISVEKHWNTDTREGRFLYAVHRQACGIFKTVLGPEANQAHHDHFHLDMALRKHGAFCE